MAETPPQLSDTDPSVTKVASANTQLDEGVFLGEGSQYRVFDLGDGHVKKVPQTLEGSSSAVSEWHKGSPAEITETARRLIGLREQGANYVRDLVTQKPEASALFGNPVFQDDGSIIQDKLIPLLEVFQEASTEQAKDLIVSYVDSVQKLWGYGCYDWVFNFLRNNSLDSKGRIVATDFGEMGFRPETMHKIIDEKKWERSYDVTQVLSLEQRDFFRATARARLTHGALARQWKKQLES